MVIDDFNLRHILDAMDGPMIYFLHFDALDLIVHAINAIISLYFDAIYATISRLCFHDMVADAVINTVINAVFNEVVNVLSFDAKAFSFDTVVG